MKDEAVAHEATIHEDVDAVAVRALHFGARCETVDADARAFFVRFEFGFGDGGAKSGGGRWNFDEFVERLLAEELVDAIGEAFDGRAVDDLLRRRRENELLAGIGERVVRDERSDVAKLGGFGFQKFAASRNGVEKIGDADRRTRRKAGGLYSDEFASQRIRCVCLRLRRRRAFRAAAARPRRSSASLRRENRAWRSTSDRPPIRSLLVA